MIKNNLKLFKTLMQQNRRRYSIKNIQEKVKKHQIMPLKQLEIQETNNSEEIQLLSTELKAVWDLHQHIGNKVQLRLGLDILKKILKSLEVMELNVN